MRIAPPFEAARKTRWEWKPAAGIQPLGVCGIGIVRFLQLSKRENHNWAITITIGDCDKILSMDPQSPPSVELTRMLKAWSGGDGDALARLTPIVYAELPRIARRNFAGEREGHLLQPSALVN